MRPAAGASAVGDGDELERAPAHWCRAPVGDALRERLGRVRRSVDDAEEAPFVAGQLRRDRLLSVLRRRAPGVDHWLPLPIPLTFRAVEELDPAALATPESGRRHVMNPMEAETVERDVQEAMSCGALVEAGEGVRAWSPMFSVRQESKTRLIFDLRAVNARLRKFDFTMETLVFLPALAAGCRYAGKLDLRAAYWQVAVDQELSMHLGTSHPADGRRTMRWTCLPFGLSVAPFVFTSITHALVRAWRAQGIIVTAYIDDIFVLSRSLEEHVGSVEIVVSDLLAAGLRISKAKTFIEPYVTLDYLGMTVHLGGRVGVGDRGAADGAFALTPKYVRKLKDGAAELLEGARVGAVRVVAIQRFLGRIAFASLAIPWLTFFRAHLTAALAHPRAQVRLGGGATEELAWWLGDEAGELLTRRWPWLVTSGTKLYPVHGARPLPRYEVHGDASEHGIGLRLQTGQLVAEPLPPELPPTASSTARELYAMVRLVERGTFEAGSVVRLVSDSSGAVRTALGATVTPGTAPWARRLLAAALEKGVVLQFEWVPRAQLSLVDAASRWAAEDASHARHSREVVEGVIAEAFGAGARMDVELFAAAHNRVGDCPFGSQYPLPGSLGDGLDQRLWRGARAGWAFPPFSLTRAALRLAVTTRPRVVVAIPDLPIIAATLRGWRKVPLPSPLSPPDFLRPLPCPPLAAFLPPQAYLTA